MVDFFFGYACKHLKQGEENLVKAKKNGKQIAFNQKKNMPKKMKYW